MARAATRQEIVEMQRCSVESFWYWVARFVYTFDRDRGGKFRFPAFKYLKKAAEAIQNNKIVFILKARQMLFSWFMCAYDVWHCATHPYRHAFIQSQKEDKSIELVNRCAFIVRNTHPGILPYSNVEISKHDITFTFPDGNESILVGVPQGADQFVQYQPTLIHSDEMALQDEAEESYYAVLPALGENAKFVGISTPRRGSFFNHMVESRPKGVAILKFTWRDHPRRDDLWAAEQRALMDPQMWKREQEADTSVACGQPAFCPPFHESTHVTALCANPALPLIRGWDFGFKHPACVILQIATTGQLLYLGEVLGKDVLLTDFINREVVELCRQIAPHVSPTDPIVWHDWCDPSGVNRRDGGPSSIDIMRQCGINVNPGARCGVKESVELVREWMKIREDYRPGTLVDPRCKMLIEAFMGAYIVDPRNENKFQGGKYEHLIDAARYAVSNEWGVRAEEWTSNPVISALTHRLVTTPEGAFKPWDARNCKFAAMSS